MTSFIVSLAIREPRHVTLPKQRSAWQVAKTGKEEEKMYLRPIPNTQSRPGGVAAWGRISKGRGIVPG